MSPSMYDYILFQFLELNSQFIRKYDLFIKVKTDAD